MLRGMGVLGGWMIGWIGWSRVVAMAEMMVEGAYVLRVLLGI